MEFSIRDAQSNPTSVLNNQRGQGLIEYVLVLVVTVALILGGLWQLNTAFKSWANNYFGNYLACLLETGELPNISGGAGDAGVCNDIFKPFTLAEGRALKPDYKSPGDTPKQKGTGTSERRGGSSYAGGGGGGGGYGGGRFTGGNFGQGGRKGSSGAGNKKASAAYTGSTGLSDYGGSGGGSRRKVSAGLKQRLDNHFAFEDERERSRKRSIASSFKKPGEEGGKAPPIRMKKSDQKKKDQEGVDSGLSLPNLLKYLLIAGIIIALFVVLGGQGLQINKSMD